MRSSGDTWFGLISALVAAAVICGCGPALVTGRSPSAQFTPQPRIAILPFDNYSGREQASGKVTEYFQTLLAGESALTLVEYGDTFEALRRHRIRSAALLTAPQIDTLAQALKIDYILTGAVLEFNELTNDYLGTIPQISFNTRLIDCRSRKTVWTGVANDAGNRRELLFGVGAVRSSDELLRQMVQETVTGIAGLFSQSK